MIVGSPSAGPRLEEQVTLALASYRRLRRVCVALLQFAGQPIDLEIEVYIVGGGPVEGVAVSQVLLDHPRTPITAPIWTEPLARALLATVEGLDSELDRL